MQTKKCSKCNKFKPENKFNTSGKPVKLKSTGKIKQYRKTLCCVCERLKHKDRINTTLRKNYHERMKNPDWAQYKRNKERNWGQTEHGKKAKKTYKIKYNNKPEVIAFKKSDEGKALQSKRNKENKAKNDPDGSRARERKKIWIKNNREKYVITRDRYNSKPEIKLRKAMRSRLNQVFIKYTKYGKKFGSSKYGILWNDIVKHLVDQAKEMGETISSLRDKDYHIDHIIACFYYDLDDVSEVAKCYNKYNLRWLPAKENSAKAHHLRPEDIEVIKTLPKKIYPKNWKGVIPTTNEKENTHEL